MPLSWELTLRFSQDPNVEQTSRCHITPEESFGHLPNPASYSFCSFPRYKAAVPQMTVLDTWIFLDLGFFLYSSFVPSMSKPSPNPIDSSSNMAHRPRAIPPVSCQSTHVSDLPNVLPCPVPAFCSVFAHVFHHNFSFLRTFSLTFLWRRKSGFLCFEFLLVCVKTLCLRLSLKMTFPEDIALLFMVLDR